MPLYLFHCNDCEYEVEVIQAIDGTAPLCPECGGLTKKQPTFPVMVKIKGAGGYPSRRKEFKGTAPYSGS